MTPPSWNATPELAPRRPSTPIAEIFDGTFHLYRQNLLAMLLVSVVTVLPAQLVAIPASLYLSPASMGLAPAGSDLVTVGRTALEHVFFGGVLTIVTGLVSATLGVIAMACMTSIALRSTGQGRISPRRAFAGLAPVMRHLVGLIALVLGVEIVLGVAGIGIALGMAPRAPTLTASEIDAWLAAIGLIGTAAGVAALFVFARLSLAVAALIAEDLAPDHALRRSWELTHGSTWHTVGVILVGVVIVGSVAALLSWLVLSGLVTSSLTGVVSDAEIVALTLVPGLATVVLGPLVPTALTVLYLDLSGNGRAGSPVNAGSGRGER